MSSPASETCQWAFVALGSNLGNSRENVLRGMDRLQELSAAPLLRSSLWRTEPVDCPPGSPSFTNAVAGVLPANRETPLSLLRRLKQIEKEFGRQPKKLLNEPRPLDLDLLTFGLETCLTDELTLPHPRLHLRAFVLEPLNELAPHLIIPGKTVTVAELLASLPPGQVIERIS